MTSEPNEHSICTQQICKCKNCSYLCAYYCPQLAYTTKHRAVL